MLHFLCSFIIINTLSKGYGGTLYKYALHYWKPIFSELQLNTEHILIICVA